jgi:hypothetical protein
MVHWLLPFHPSYMNALLTLPSILLFAGTYYSKISSVYIDFQVWYFIFTNLFQYIMISIVIVPIENMSIISTCFNAISDQPFAGALEYARTCYISSIFMLNDD